MNPSVHEVVLGIDLGTTYFKVGFFDAGGALRGLGRVPAPVRHPAPGQCEMSPDDFWDALAEALRQAFAQGDIAPEQLRGLSYSSQANTFLALDAEARPLSPLILWTDTRAPICQEVAALWQRDDFVARTGIGVPLSPNAALNKIQALRRTWTAPADTSLRVMTISDYLTHGLSGQFDGDGGTACLLGIEAALPEPAWWPEALSALGFESRHWARLLRPGAAAGAVTPAAARRLGLPVGLPLAVGSLDHHMAALGAGLGTAADLSESTGTVMACLSRRQTFAPRAGCCIGPDVSSGFFELAWDGNGGAALEWYQKQMAGGIALAELDREADAVDPGSEGLRALPNAHRLEQRERFQGRRPLHGRGHEMRALLESTSASLCAIIEILCEGAPPRGVIATGGGARSPVWMQIKADMLGAPFHVPDCPEPACRGAALLAAMRAGWFDSIEQAAVAWQPVFRRYPPRPAVHQIYRAWRQQ